MDKTTAHTKQIKEICKILKQLVRQTSDNRVLIEENAELTKNAVESITILAYHTKKTYLTEL
tara:strand:+ start:1350 stop:1535 length:186 start_codon:yes stop_codon:yes gene_type:complete